jgi:hypothetical protein
MRACFVAVTAAGAAGAPVVNREFDSAQRTDAFRDVTRGGLRFTTQHSTDT